ncbi:MAG: nucleotidyltransferase family protein [Archangium sp.]
MLELFRTLTSFSPKRVDLRGAPWEAFTDWSIAQGLAPLAAYNLEYRLGASTIPDWVRHRLLSIYQGSANDNVMKLVNLKQSLAELTGRRIVMLGGVSFSESVYPHVAFRPVIDARLYVSPGDVEPLSTWLRRAEFTPVEGAVDAAGAQKVLSDSRTQIFIHGGFFDDAREDAALLSRAVPMRPFGASAYRFELEDALLVQVLLMSRQRFEVPMLEFIDLRELLLGAPSMGGAYSRPVDASKILERARAWKLERSLYVALGTLERLWPETAEVAAQLRPSLSFPVRELLDRVAIAPLAEVGRTERLKGIDTLRSLLTGE